MAFVDLQNRAPEVVLEPDFRQRVTRRYDVLNSVPKTPAEILAHCWLPLGTVDDKYTTCYLIDQHVEGQAGDFYEPCKFPPVLVRVFEELDGLNETLVGQPGVVMDQYGNQSVILDYWQLNLGTATYAIPGQTAAPAPFTACILKTEERTNDGTLRKIKRTYINKGELSDTEQLKFGGKLLLRELTYLNQVPPTPSGWELVTQSTDFIQGLPVYKYGFVNGGGGGGGAGGKISSETVYNRSPDQGTTGVTVTTIRYITATSVVVNPITGPGGSQLISVQFEDQDGYRLWTAIYAKGQGVVTSAVETKEGGKLIVYSKTAINSAPSAPSPTINGTVVLIRADVSNGTRVEDGTVIYDYTWAEGLGTVSSDVETKEGGKLILYHITALGVAPSAPAPTIGGTVTQVDAEVRQSDGYPIYEYRWAEGNGEIDRTIEYVQSSDAGTTGVTRTTIRALTALGASDPTTPPSGTVQVAFSSPMQDGYLLWTVTYAKGVGTVVTDVQLRNNGLLVIYRRTALGSAPSAPSPTIGGTVVSTSTDVRESEGYKIYDYTWAEGKGEIFYDIEQRNNGALTLYRKRSLGVAPTPPATTGIVASINLTFTGSGYFTVPTVVIAGGGGTGATAVAVLAGGGFNSLADIIVTNGGTGYTSAPTVMIVGGAPGNATAVANLAGVFGLTQTDAYQEQQDGVTLYGASWASGYGVVEIRIQPREGGLRLETWVSYGISVGTAVFTPPGIKILQDSEQMDGFTKYTVTCMQSATGGDPTAYSYSSEAWIPFGYPGRAKEYLDQLTTGGNLYWSFDIFLSPPTTALVLGTKTISYQTSSSVGSLSPALWNPKDYATVHVAFVNSSGQPQSIVKGFEGYGAFPAGTTSFFYGGGVAAVSVLGQTVYLNTGGVIQLTGGPTSPDGSTAYTLHAEVEQEPAFVGYDGTKYFRKIVITATPAAQAALPV